MSFYDTLRQQLDTSSVAYCLHEHAPSITVGDAENNLTFPVDQLLKTVAFRVKNGGWVLAALCGHRQVDYKKLAATCGVSRDKLMRLTPDEVERDLGFPLGGVGPFAPNSQTRVFVDEATLAHPQVFCGMGRTDRTLEIAPADLVAVSGASVVPLAKEAV
jgi:Cys-tRNA(Pro)/Cys-tRNA(Cys) deacylase